MRFQGKEYETKSHHCNISLTFSILWVSVVFCLSLRLLETSSFYTSMPISDIHVEDILRQACCWDFMDEDSFSHSGTTISQHTFWSCKFYNLFSSSFCIVSWVSAVEIALEIHRFYVDFTALHFGQLFFNWFHLWQE